VSTGGRGRPLVAVALAVIVVAGLVAADAVTLHKAKPSYDHETQAFQRLLEAPTTTTTPITRPGATGVSPTSTVVATASGVTTVTSGTTVPSRTASTGPPPSSTTGTASGSP
jgi:hypothetical protein